MTNTKKIFRKHGRGLSKISLHLSAPDMAGIKQVRTVYETRTGLSLSSSLIISLGITALIAETTTGVLRRSPELYVGKDAT